MDGYEVDIEGLRKAAGAARSAGEQAAEIKLGDAARSVGEAMSGSASAGRAPVLADAWDKRLNTWSADIIAFGGGLAGSADYYERNEEAAEADFTILGGLFGGAGG